MDTDDRYRELRELTAEDRKAIYELAMKRSEEIIRGLDDPSPPQVAEQEASASRKDE